MPGDWRERVGRRFPLDDLQSGIGVLAFDCSLWCGVVWRGVVISAFGTARIALANIFRRGTATFSVDRDAGCVNGGPCVIKYAMPKPGGIRW